ncbi:hypothetical protein DMENIID0001_158770 [Sergentomyia squamirostris]
MAPPERIGLICESSVNSNWSSGEEVTSLSSLSPVGGRRGTKINRPTFATDDNCNAASLSRTSDESAKKTHSQLQEFTNQTPHCPPGYSAISVEATNSHPPLEADTTAHRGNSCTQELNCRTIRQISSSHLVLIEESSCKKVENPTVATCKSSSSNRDICGNCADTSGCECIKGGPSIDSPQVTHNPWSGVSLLEKCIRHRRRHLFWRN